MARRIGAFIEWDVRGFRELEDVPREMADRVTDLTPVMTVVATADLKPDMLDHLQTQGDGTWPAKSPNTIKRHGDTPLGVGSHGGFAPTIQRGWSKSNAVAFTRAPHAHLFGDGTQQYRTQGGARAFRWGSKAGRSSRGRSRAFMQSNLSSLHQPARFFAYINDPVQERATRRVGAFVVGDPYDGAV
jgi:hypothetical protein